MLKRTLLILSVVLPLVLTADEPRDKALKMVISNWAPYKSKELPNEGFASDITRKALIRAGFKVETIFAPWKRALAGTISGEYDVVPALWKTPERAESLTFSNSILDSRVVVITLSSYPFNYTKLEDLKGHTVGVGRGWGYPDTFSNADYFTREPVVDLELNIKKLLYGRLKIIVGEELATRYTVTKKFKDSAARLSYSKISISENPLHVGFSMNTEDNKRIAEKFNQALEKMKKDGSFDEILKFHGVSQSE